MSLYKKRPEDDWGEFWDRHCSISINARSVIFPDERTGFTRLLWIPAGLSIKRVVVASQQCFSVRGQEFDLPTVRDARVPKHDYVIRVRDNLEADHELWDMWPHEMFRRNIGTETMLERLVHGLKVFEETGQHLDIKGWTKCMGSRYYCGNVPCVRWHAAAGELETHNLDPLMILPRISARQVITA